VCNNIIRIFVVFVFKKSIMYTDMVLKGNSYGGSDHGAGEKRKMRVF
jgi:hypothetical protein